MDFSTMVLTMYVAVEDGPAADERVLGIAVEQSLLAAELGFNPWFTEHHFRGPWHSNPIQFASYIAPQIGPDRYLGFGVLSIPYYHPVRLVEAMNQLDQLTKGRTLYGLGSGFAGLEPLGMGLDADYHSSGRAAEDTLEIMERLWDFQTGDPELVIDTPVYKGTVRRRVTPSPYRKRHPTVIRTASRDSSVIKAAQRGLPAFLGIFSAESPLAEQIRIYREALVAANHPQHVIDECLRWCTCDWLAVVVADTDEEAQARAKLARAEHLAMRDKYVAEHGPLHGPVVRKKPEESTPAAFAAGGDMLNIIAGTPDTVAAKVQELADLGINHLLVRFLGEWPGETRYISEESMRLFAREVMPRFKSSAKQPALV
ncbi:MULTISPECIES: LLM class flavin-dependent oxidoreductase [unclassified Beijerinckia]|uniref:LLM class flavin-dependent oxidoreductase n=1 Tax=unclassified Beijerinckia TaxID=2638183 RepID=UPI00089726BC|nr:MULTISPECIES: LLM class flavin-dependent oxidoreductase [unclassified Beijerinckia]MDH7795058.1 alkanesulfonate monooxygenase SsuD/methylene tetrahydromethanopterin reductase-like flavin-dependent oxidoreductase (luciferase family) [Beijerinckia sp. GAS462]SEB85868.1 Flavin-dependent oxidoreductase, luciferase family (includes alkanesulfonate monooxygenase SsuD and methylene tetrahydromethanopterin reductase) [Beijerinckia sp. 28-YEA-48]